MNEILRQLAENILTDLTQDAPIANTMLRVKVFAFKKRDNDLLSWIEHELDGYKETLPNAVVRGDVHRGFQDMLGYN